MRQLGTMASSTTLTLWGWALPLLLDTKVSLPVQAAPVQCCQRQTDPSTKQATRCCGRPLPGSLEDL